MELEELGDLVKSVAHDRGLDIDVVGVTIGEGDSQYAEVIVDVARPLEEPQRMSMGLMRNKGVRELRSQISSKLDG